MVKGTRTSVQAKLELKLMSPWRVVAEQYERATEFRFLPVIAADGEKGGFWLWGRWICKRGWVPFIKDGDIMRGTYDARKTTIASTTRHTRFSPPRKASNPRPLLYSQTATAPQENGTFHRAR